MLNSNPDIVALDNAELLAATRAILRRACVVEADLLVHLAEIEERRLHSEMAFPTMFAFCVDELGFSEDQAYNRTTVARVARRIPAILDSLRFRSGSPDRTASPRSASDGTEPPRSARGGGWEVEAPDRRDRCKAPPEAARSRLGAKAPRAA